MTLSWAELSRHAWRAGRFVDRAPQPAHRGGA